MVTHSDDYGIGALVLAQSLKETGTTRPLACMITSEVSESMKCRLSGSPIIISIKSKGFGWSFA